MKILGRLILFLFFLVALSYLFGSKPDSFDVNPTIASFDMPSSPDQYVSELESNHNIRPGNQARIIWADSTKKKTPYALVYLHGFTASHVEGSPVHEALSKRYGMNLYLARLAAHGLQDNEPLAHFRADEYVESAKQAIQIGHELGDDIIVIGTSTGATLAAYLAAANPELIDILLFFAPNINVADPRSFLLTHPWGRELAETLEGDYLKQGMQGEEFDKYWYPKYRTSSAVELMSLIEHTMTDEIFERINQPTFISYYFKNENEKDDIISIEHIHQFYYSIKTTDAQKRMATSPKSGNHVTISNITSKDILTPFLQACEFIEQVCHIEVSDTTSVNQLLNL